MARFGIDAFGGEIALGEPSPTLRLPLGTMVKIKLRWNIRCFIKRFSCSPRNQYGEQRSAKGSQIAFKSAGMQQSSFECKCTCTKEAILMGAVQGKDFYSMCFNWTTSVS
jgi:hypothetical protein